MKYEFRLTGTSVVIPLMEILAEEMEMLKRTHPLEGVPLYFARVPHRRPDTKELTGLTFTWVWPDVKGSKSEDDEQPIGTLWRDGEAASGHPAVHSDAPGAG